MHSWNVIRSAVTTVRWISIRGEETFADKVERELHRVDTMHLVLEYSARGELDITSVIASRRYGSHGLPSTEERFLSLMLWGTIPYNVSVHV